MKRRLIRLVVGLVLAGAVGFAALFGFAQFETWGNRLLPKSSWPVLEAAKTDNSSGVRVAVGDDILVNPVEDGIQYYYCDLAADPHNPGHLFASSLVHTPKSKVPGQHADLTDLAGFYSHDRGRSWARAFYFAADTGNPDAAERESFSDSSVCWGRDGSVHLAVMHGIGFERFVPKKAGDQPLRTHHSVDFWTSVDSGVSWKQKAGVPYYMDRPFTIVDTTAGSRAGRQYTIAQNRKVEVFANAEDDARIGMGKSLKQEFTNPRPANPVLLRDGTVLFAVEESAPKWLGVVRPDAARQILTFRCSDGEQIVRGTPINTHWSHPSLDNAARPFFTVFPRLGANPHSQKFVDHVYCVWAGCRSITGARDVDSERVFVSVSRDGGHVWDQPVLLSEQPLEANLDHDFLTALPNVAVNHNGVVAVSWYDRRGLPQSDSRGKPNALNRSGWNVRSRISVDGGASWLPSVQLNRKQSKGEFYVGHTAGLAAAADGRFHALWIDASDGTRQVHTTSFGVDRHDDATSAASDVVSKSRSMKEGQE